MLFKKVTVVGLGLIGGSLAWALKQSGKVEEVSGVDIEEKTLRYAIRQGIVDNGSRSIQESIEGSQIVVIATHVGLIPMIAKAIIGCSAPETILTDVGSVKSSVIEEIESFIPPEYSFVGGHPISGTEHSGITFSNPNLFNSKRCILTPTSKTSLSALNKVKSLWEAIGATVLTMDPETHDRVFAFVSHLPHAVAYTLINTVASEREPENILSFAGGGLKDFTRISESSPEMWSEILIANRKHLLDSIQAFKEEIERLHLAIENNDLQALMEQLRRAAGVKKSLD